MLVCRRRELEEPTQVQDPSMALTFGMTRVPPPNYAVKAEVPRCIYVITCPGVMTG